MLLVPGEDAVVLDVEMPARVSRGAADRIAFHAVQDLVGEEMADIHFVRLPRERDPASNRRRVLVTSRACMSAWLARAERAGARPVAMLPDYLALPWEPGAWTVQVECARLRARFGRFDGFAAETELGAAILERRVKDASPAPERIRLLVEPDAAQDTVAAALPWLGAAGIATSRETPPAGPPGSGTASSTPT